ncbi:biotin synthase [Methanobrevibacter cuticularis]|uniref:Biotin synthase n=1 Tax=Methanobrevibacter cuticularis TaxID=47311 RepID=A0A166F7Y0_9EURY|nr:radical SAM protein [Methanobrevibacter cuticularis]KZX17410.1 biotin synthase [Methanobrevibacter cuticularis]
MEYDENYLFLKADLLTEGVQSDKESLEGVGTKYKEQNHGLFGWDFESHPDVKLPDDFYLPDGTVVQFRLNSSSQYNIRKEEDKLYVYKNNGKICEVKWMERPEYYNKKTSSGKDMIKIGQIGGDDCLFFCFQNYCSNFQENNQCSFCNLVSTSKTYNSVIRKKEAEDIGEVAAAAWAEGKVNHINMTGGCYISGKELEVVDAIASAIKKHTGKTKISGLVAPAPAKGDNIQGYFDTGIQSLSFNMEVWDEGYYKAICPGKSATTSHDEFITSITQAIDIYGRGNVYVSLVMGLEPRETFLEGIETLSSMGVNVIPFVWAPNPGSKLEGHRAPSAQWYVDTILEAAEIVYKHKVPWGTENHCYLCDGNSLLHDALRLKGIE